MLLITISDSRQNCSGRGQNLENFSTRVDKLIECQKCVLQN